MALQGGNSTPTNGWPAGSQAQASPSHGHWCADSHDQCTPCLPGLAYVSWNDRPSQISNRKTF